MELSGAEILNQQFPGQLRNSQWEKQRSQYSLMLSTQESHCTVPSNWSAVFSSALRMLLEGKCNVSFKNSFVVKVQLSSFKTGLPQVSEVRRLGGVTRL